MKARGRFFGVVFLIVVSLTGTSLCAQVLPAKVKYETPMLALVFVTPDCPISQKYMARLNEMHASFSAEITWLAVVPGNVSKQEIKAFSEEYQSPLNFLPDKDFVLVKALNARVTPEIFLFDQSRALVYHGAIDNWFYELGKNRREVTEHYFLDAVKAVQTASTPTVKATEAVGCFIQAPADHHRHH